MPQFKIIFLDGVTRIISALSLDDAERVANKLYPHWEDIIIRKPDLAQQEAETL